MRGWKVAAAAGLVLAVAASPLLAQEGHNGRVTWRTDVQQAIADAQAQGKPIWFLASADW